MVKKIVTVTKFESHRSRSGWTAPEASANGAGGFVGKDDFGDRVDRCVEEVVHSLSAGFADMGFAVGAVVASDPSASALHGPRSHKLLTVEVEAVS
jgi:hypothetical protein